jgi:hypothetical protein
LQLPKLTFVPGKKRLIPPIADHLYVPYNAKCTSLLTFVRFGNQTKILTQKGGREMDTKTEAAGITVIHLVVGAPTTIDASATRTDLSPGINDLGDVEQTTNEVRVADTGSSASLAATSSSKQCNDGSKK